MIRKVPHGWEVKTLGEITDIFKGGTPKRNVERYFQGNIPWVTPTDITKLNGALYIDDTETHISEEALGKSAARLLPAGAVLLTSRATIGKVAIARVPIATNQGFANFLCKEEIVNIFLAYYLRLSTDLLISLGTGTTFLEVTKAALLGVEIPVPPLPTQYKIAAVLSAYDDLIENNTRRIEILEEMAQAIYREWFVDFRFPGYEGVEMVESELGLIPQGWKVGILGDLAESVRRNIKPSDINQETPYFGLEHLPRKSIALTDWDVVDSINSAKLAFKKGEILFGKIRPYFHKVGVAPLDGICSSDTIVMRPKRNECFAMSLSCVSSEHFIEYATITSQGTKMPRADWKVLVKYPVIIPPDQITQRFSSFVRDIVNQIHSLIFRNRNLRQTRDLLLPKLISGEIDVSKLDIDTNRIQPKKGGTHIPKSLKDWLHSDENILGGDPVIKGTRLTVAFLLELLECGWSEKEVLENYPNIRLEHIDACLTFQQGVTRASASR